MLQTGAGWLLSKAGESVWTVTPGKEPAAAAAFMAPAAAPLRSHYVKLASYSFPTPFSAEM